MKEERSLNNTRRLRRATRNVVDKCYDFSRSKKAGKLCQKSGRRGFYYDSLLQELKVLLEDMRAQVEDFTAANMLTQLSVRVGGLQTAIQFACRTQSKIDKREVTKVLWQHTSTFNYILRHGVQLGFSHEKWSNLVLPAVVLWGDRVNGLSLVPIAPMSRRARTARKPQRYRQAFLPFAG